LPWFGPFQFVAIVGKGDGQAVCRGASAETDIVGRLGIVDSWDGTTFIAGLAAMMFYATAMLIGNSVGENTFRKTRGDNSEPARNICFGGSSATNRLTIALAYYGNGLERSEPQQIF